MARNGFGNCIRKPTSSCSEARDPLRPLVSRPTYALPAAVCVWGKRCIEGNGDTPALSKTPHPVPMKKQEIREPKPRHRPPKRRQQQLNEWLSLYKKNGEAEEVGHENVVIDSNNDKAYMVSTTICLPVRHFISGIGAGL